MSDLLDKQVNLHTKREFEENFQCLGKLLQANKKVCYENEEQRILTMHM